MHPLAVAGQACMVWAFLLPHLWPQLVAVACVLSVAGCALSWRT